MALLNFILRKILEAVKVRIRRPPVLVYLSPCLFVHNFGLSVLISSKNSQKVVVHTRQILRSLRAGIMPVRFFI